VRVCKTPEAQYHIRIGPRVVSCMVEIPFDLGLTKLDAVELENKVHDALEDILQAYWNREEEFELSFNETYEELLERKLGEQKSASV